MGKTLSRSENGGIEGIGMNENEIFSDYVVSFSYLPEGCVATIISFTWPHDACRFALISKTFRSAADSDAVWGSFFRFDYNEIISRSTDATGGSMIYLLNSLSKKQLYFRLVNLPLLIDNGTKSFSVDKWSGKSCYMLAARSLAIVWGDTPMYWSWPSTQESRFGEVAELMSVCWLDIKGKIKPSMLSPQTLYGAYFVFKMTEECYGFYNPVHVSVGIDGYKTNSRKIFLQRQMSLMRRMPGIGRGPAFYVGCSMSRRLNMPSASDEGPKPREDGWLEVELGEIYIQGDEGGDVEMSLLEIDGGNWKRGLIVQGFEMRPKVD